MVCVLGSIYAGVATPTEGAAVGCFVAVIISVVWGKFGFKEFDAALTNTIRVSCTVIFIVFTAFIFAYAVENAGVGTNLTKWFIGLGLNKYAFLFSLVVMYCILGCLIDSIGMIVLTVPLLFGSVVAYGFDPVWFGIILVVFVELGQISPPIGINLYVVQAMWNGKLSDVVLGTIPFHIIMLVLLFALVAWPQIALWLPSKMIN